MSEELAPAEPRRKRWLVPLLVGALVVALAVAGVFVALWLKSSQTSSSEVRNYLLAELPSVEERSRELIDLLMNYDATNLDERADSIRALATGSFRDQYDELIQQGLGQALEKASASSTGQIIDGPNVSFKAPSEALAIARVSQTTQSRQNPAGRTFMYVLQIGLVKTPDRGWLADHVEILSEQVA